MRIDLPQCNLKACRYFSDHNCTNRIEYDSCPYQLLKSYMYFIEDTEILKNHGANANRIAEAVERTKKYIRED